MQISKKIALIELQTHAEVFYHFAKLLNGQATLQLFTTPAIYQDAPEELKKNPRNHWIIIAESQTQVAFLRQQLSKLQSCETVLFVTIVRDFRFYATLPVAAQKIWLVHNSRAVFQPKVAIQLPFSWSKKYVLDALRVLKFFLFQEGKHKQQMLQHFDKISLPSPFIKKYVTENLQPINPNKLVYFDLSFFENHPTTATKNTITITIPGTITNEGRDYQMVINALKSIIPSLKNKVQLILAGRPSEEYGQQIIAQVQTLASPFFEPIVFEKSIPQTAYEAILASTDFLILPFKKTVKYSIYQEINGFSKISGSINDQIRFGLPALITTDYPLPLALENLSKRFADEEALAANLMKWLMNRQFEKLRKEKGLLKENYTEEKVRKRLLTML